MDYDDPLNQDDQPETRDHAQSQHEPSTDDFPWMRDVEWMKQAQPIPPEHFPRATAPTVYEGYVPALEGRTAYQEPVQRSSLAFPWPSQKPPLPDRQPVTLQESSGFDTSGSSAYHSRIRLSQPDGHVHFMPSVRTGVNEAGGQLGGTPELRFSDHFTHPRARLSTPLLRASPFNHQNGARVRYPSMSRAQTPTPQVHVHSSLFRSEEIHSYQQHSDTPPQGYLPLQQDRPGLYYQPVTTQSMYPDESLRIRNAPIQPQIGYTPDNRFGQRDEQSDFDEYEDEAPEEGQNSTFPPVDLSTNQYMEEVHTQYIQPNETAKPKSRRRQKGGKRGLKGGKSDPRSGTRQALDPGEDFKKLHGEATESFLMGNVERALEQILEAISINPEINSAHVMLSEIYFSLGDSDKAIAALFSGAHAAPNDPSLWLQVADACLQRSTATRGVVLGQAAYCFTRLLNIDQEDYDARFQKAVISRELGHHAKALKDLDTILKAMPYNPSILKEYAEVCLDTRQLQRAKNLYEEALDKLQAGAVTDVEVFGWGHLIVYIDLVSQSEGTVKAIAVLKEVGRLLVGRTDETFWNDVVEDDREWDLEDMPRRMQVPAFQPGHHPIESYGTSLPLELRMKLAEFRLTQSQREEALSHFEWLEPEGLMEGDKIFDYPDLFVQVAHSLREAKEFSQALRYYDALRNVNAEFDGEDGVNFWLGIAACAYIGGAKDSALEYYENVKALDPQNIEALTQLSKLYADKGLRTLAIKTAKIALAANEQTLPKTEKRRYERKETREARKAAQEALKIAYAIPRKHGEKDLEPLPSFSRRMREKAKRKEREEREAQEAGCVPEDRPTDLPKPKKRLTKAQRTRDQQEQHVRQLYNTLCGATAGMRDGDDEARSIWIECAEALVEEFRSHKVFYPPERYKIFRGYSKTHVRKDADTTDTPGPEPGEYVDEDVPMASIESTVPNDFYGIVFSSWLNIFLEYALLLANLQYEQSECYTIITAAQDCIVWYHDTDAMTQIYMCYIACALALQDDNTLFGVALRWFMREYAFCSDIYRLFSALNFYFPHSPDKGGKMGQMTNAKFRAGPNQKFLFRHVLAIDRQLPANYGVDTKYGPVPEFARRERHDTGYLRTPAQGRESTVNAADPSSQLPTPSTPDPGATFSTSQQPVNSASDTRSLQPVELDVVLLVLYAQILYAGGSFPSALSYLYRAHSVDPNNALVIFSMALCYMHQMFKRQNENRHMYLLQGWALFEEYATVRLAWAKEKQAAAGEKHIVDTIRREIEFNRARCMHMVGLADLAMRGYEKMMSFKRIKSEDEMDVDVDADGDGAEKNKKKGDEYSMEAAYAMATMYALNGDTETARLITEKWLVVE